MDPLESGVTTVRYKIQRSELAFANHVNTPLSAQEVQQHIQKLAHCSVSADQLQLQLTSRCKTLQEVTENEKEFADIESRIIKCSSLFSQLLESMALPSTSKAVSLPPRTSTDVKLPRLELPTFSGTYSDWLPFHDLFSATIDQNSSLTGAQKLQYLKSSLKNEAAQLISSLQVTNNNYAEAWNLLKERYDNKREIVLSQLDRLFSQPSMESESPAAIRKLIDTTSEVLRSLTVLKLPVDQWDMILIYTITRKLDSESRRQWELSLTTDDLPSWKDLQAFLDRRARALSAAGSDDTNTFTSSRVIKGAAPAPASGRRNAVTHFGATGSACPVCSSGHFIQKCPEFAAYSIQQKKNMVKQHKLCFNCLRGGHFTSQCKGGACRTCGGHHHTLLHSDTQQQYSASPKPPASPNHSSYQDKQQHVFKSNPDKNEAGTAPDPTVSTHFARHDDSPARVLLQTALINVVDVSGSSQICRALLDSGSQASFISEECAQRLGLPRKRTHVPLRGISSQEHGSARSYVSFKFVSCYDNNRSFHVDALVLTKVTSFLPQIPLDRSSWTHLTGIRLADPNFDIPGKIDILLGADLFGELLLDSKISGKKGTPIAHQSHVGWVLSGKLDKSAELQSITSHHVSLDSGLDITLRRFWELEEVPESKHLTEEEKACENHFLQTYSRLENGRFSVSLPFRKDKQPLGESRSIAIRRLKYMERKLNQKDDYYNQYRAFMKEYEDLGHMQLINQDDIFKKEFSEVCYLPHHFILKESSTTTKFRTVFDASAKTASGFSLNDTLMVGGKLQDDIASLLIRFRKWQIVMTADIEKMYRQILIHPQDRDYLRIVWRDSPEMPIKDYKLCTVTYGTSPAPFQAVFAVQQLAKEERVNFPLASSIILSDLYMDDLFSGKDCISQALELQRQLIQLLERGGFKLRKWSSNHPSLLESLSEDMRETKLPLTFDHDTGIKALGIQWQPSTDTFQYRLSLPPADENLTKRKLLSDIAKLYDPLGWLSPVTVKAKILMQEVWIVGCGWDHTLPTTIQEKWIHFREDLNAIEDIRIPRHVMQSNCLVIELHGFSDASTAAYGAVVYTRTISSDGKVKVSMVAAKTKVAPIRQISLPKLELCGAVLVRKLLETVKKSLQIEVNNTFGWTDNTTVLAWLQSHPSRWSTFVANRVATIHEYPIVWNHIAGEVNPADCASRGITATTLLTHPLWWNGPEFLQNKDWKAPDGNIMKISDEVIAEQRKTKVVAHISINMDIINEFSSLPKLQRVAAYCLRYIHNKLCTPAQRRIGFLTAPELDQALNNLILRAQHQEFHEDIQHLKKNKPLSNKSKIASLNPFLDKSGLLRVGGRLKEANITLNRRYPILLPPGHRLTEMIIQHYHLKYLHAGSQLLLASLQQKYWLLRGRDVTRLFVKKCITCFRHSAELANQQMGNLPPERVNPARPFLKCGVDYAGPINLKIMKGRNRKTFKGYIAVFVCFTTKALHLELVSDLSTDAFLAAFRRFISRRGICSDIYSDCGTNFVGAAKEIKILRAQFSSQKRNEEIAQQLLNDGVTWHFNPPSAPHMGGIWEAGVKSVKYHLKRTLNETTLDFEEMTTLLTQIEACLNSRPLTALSSDPDDVAALTPGHFLIGGPLKSLPEPDLAQVKMNHLSRWQYLQRLMQTFWKRWSTEYLSKLQQRPRWWSKKENVKIGDLVLIKDNRLPPSSWNLGRITEVHPGKDNLVRVVDVRVLDNVDSSHTFTYKTFSRPIAKLAVLPFDSD